MTSKPPSPENTKHYFSLNLHNQQKTSDYHYLSVSIFSQTNISTMDHEFTAIVNIYAVPKPKHRNYYKKEWSSKPLFSCAVCVNPYEGGTDRLNIRLKSLTDGSVVATAPYDGQHGVHSVVDSAKHYVFVVRNSKMHAWLGVEFRDPTDSTLFSLTIQKFMQRRMLEYTGMSAWSILPKRVESSSAV